MLFCVGGENKVKILTDPLAHCISKVGYKSTWHVDSLLTNNLVLVLDFFVFNKIRYDRTKR